MTSPVAAIDGEIDASNVAERRRPAARACSPTAARRSSSTSSATTYIDSAGINLLFELADELRQRQQRLLLVVAEQSPIAPHARASPASTAPSPIHPTREAAVRAAGTSPP